MNKEENVASLVKAINITTGVTLEEIRSGTRVREVVWSRYIFNYIAKTKMLWNEKEIYQFLHYDRTSIYHGEFKHNQMYKLDKEYTSLVDRTMLVFEGEAESCIKETILNKRILAGIDIY